MARRRRRRSSSDGLLTLLLAGAGIFVAYSALSWASEHPEVFLVVLLVVVAVVAWPVIRWWRRLQSRRAYRQMLRQANMDVIDGMPGAAFEETLGLLFEDLGYRVERTKAVGDFGADLVIEQNGGRTIVQAKRYSQPVGVKAVQEAYAAQPHYRADAAWVISNSTFTPAARKLAASTGVQLWDRGRLGQELARARQGQDQHLR
jgi:restriction system protein